MRKNALIFLSFFMFFLILNISLFAHPLNTFVIQETEKLSLVSNASDPDSDRLTISYSSPLNSMGEWQTKYGDAGEYMVKVMASDGNTNTSEDVAIRVLKKEEKPILESFTPQIEIIDILEGDSVRFEAYASDLNMDNLSYSWHIGGVPSGIGHGFLYDAAFEDAGTQRISLAVSDGTNQIKREWTVNVQDVDVERLLDEIKGITVNENDVARLDLPDLSKYGLVYSVSQPLGDRNEWNTSYDDSGAYSVEIDVNGKGFTGRKFVDVVVKDVDRDPVFDPIGEKKVDEGEELKITLSAHDQDGDKIAYSGINLPEGISIDGNVFTWKPDYDVVKRSGFLNSLWHRFGGLTRKFDLTFTATSRNKTISQDMSLIVRNEDAPPVIDEIEDIKIKEGDTLRIIPRVNDPDGDKLSITYSGFMDRDTFKSGFDDAGEYYVKVTASDGNLEASTFVRIVINQTNRPPVLKRRDSIKIAEGDDLAILLDAKDPDGDDIRYSADNPPEDSYLRGNTFFWNPPYSLSSRKETKKFEIVFVADDGTTQSRQVVHAEVMDINRPPRITEYSKAIVAKVNRPVLMFIKAVDDDGDPLTYTWNFGFFDSYKATAAHQRIFTKRGAKTIKVAVSDGMDSVEQVINVNVI